MNDLGNKKIMGENIKRQMARLGVSRKEIASALQVPYSTVCEWISGNAYPRIDKIQLLAQYFGITKAQLVEAPDVYKRQAAACASAPRICLWLRPVNTGTLF